MPSTEPAPPRVTIYGTRWCGYCMAARRMLSREGIAYVEHDVSRDRGLRAEISAQTGWRTVPMIFIDDTFVGGYAELSAYRRTHGFDELRSPT